MSNTRELDAMWMETDCPECGVTYRWHREHRNVCPNGHDFGFLLDLDELRDLMTKLVERKEALEQQ